LIQNDQIPQDNTRGGGRISMGSAVPLLQGPGLERFTIWGVHFYLCIHPLSQNTKFDVVTHMGRGWFSGSQPRTHTKGAGSQRSPILGVSFYLCVTVCRSTLSAKRTYTRHGKKVIPTRECIIQHA